MSKPPIALLCAAVLALGLYLWGALAAPVVLWSDSKIDMDWARTGVGIVRPVPPPPPGEPLVHPPKVGYLLFLAGAMRAAPNLGEARSVVLVQSLLLWLSIAATSWLVARRAGQGAGLAALLLLLAVLRVRDASSAVMSEAISAALFLPLAALAIWKPRRLRGSAFTGIGAALLFAIRPDVGAILFLLTAAILLAHKSWRSLSVYAASFLLLAVGVWLLTRPVAGPDSLRGLGHPILEGSADYYWRPSLGQWPRAQTQKEMGSRELERAAANWKRTLSHLDSDTRRDLLWRAFHGLLGTEFYDARWSRLYGSLDEASRVLTPFWILAAVAGLLFPSRPPESGSRIAGGLLLLCVIGHNLLFGSNPRYLIPVLPFLLLLLAIRLPRPDVSASQRAAAGVLFALLIFAAFLHREVLDWQWGQVESAGVTIRQPIPRGALPRRVPATLHIRIAPPLVPTNANIYLSSIGRQIWSSEGSGHRQRPEISVALPAWILEENARSAVAIDLTSFGNYDRYSYLLFPVIPLPWGCAAQRDGGKSLSPATGIRSGSLDWWAHAGPAD